MLLLVSGNFTDQNVHQCTCTKQQILLQWILYKQKYSFAESKIESLFYYNKFWSYSKYFWNYMAYGCTVGVGGHFEGNVQS